MKLGFAVFLVMAFMVSIQWFTESYLLANILREAEVRKGEEIAELFSKLSVAPLRRLDYATIRWNAENLRQNREIVSVRLRDRGGFNLTPFATASDWDESGNVAVRRDIADEIGTPLGDIEIVFSLASVRSSVDWMRGILLGGFVAVLVASWFSISVLLRFFVVTPIRAVVASMEKVAAGDLGQSVPVGSSDEIGTLAANFNEMARRLSASLETQLRSEKMAALGGLVAGVSHEINTPVGVCITAVSHLGETSEATAAKVADGTLTRRDLDQYLRTVAEVSSIVEKNLHTAASLIRSFKQISADQASDLRRAIDLRVYLGEIVSSVLPELRRANVAVSVDCPEGISIELHPGPLSQAVTILLMNAKIHAFEGLDKGAVTLRAWREPSRFGIEISDDGKGMESAVLARVFDPFFTTKRGSGGTGLGLYILYTIVRDRFGGQVTVDSMPGKGSRFTMVFPVDGKEIRFL